jgi:regulator of protease activity HflC (stomatin/prohibitin superfamily)
MGRSILNGLTIIGVVFLVIAALVFVEPFFTVHETTEVARLGDLKVETTQARTYTIPPFLGGAALVLGAGFISAGLLRRR